MTTHFGLMVVFSVFVSVVFATLMRDEPREQVMFGGRLFAGLMKAMNMEKIGFIGAGVLIGWLLYPLPL